MQELVPYISCLINPTEFEAALASNYSEVYIKTSSGLLKHIKLVGNRHVRLKVDSLPKGFKLKDDVDVAEEINFLPAGKIPYSYFEQILTFFKEVMRLKNADYEAHAWILWSQERGYFISVPKQTVSKASVQFTYDQESLPPGSIIVVDYHSHNTMGAFYSGTDDANDAMGIYYSGVLGQLDKPSPASVLRFNMLKDKRPCKLSDIFDMSEREVQIPPEWLDKVEVQKSFTSGAFRQQGRKPGKEGSNMGKGQAWFMNPDLWASGEVGPFGLEPEADEGTDKNGRPSKNEGDEFHEGMKALFDQAEDLEEEAARHFGIITGSLDNRSREPDPVGSSNHSDDFDANACDYGKDAALAFENIADLLDEVAQHDNLLLSIIRAAHELLGPSGQMELAQSGL